MSTDKNFPLRYLIIWNFQTPAPLSPSDSRSCKVYALDCEMVYTRRGLSLARIILVNCKGETVLDIIVKPESPVMDYNTRFSGLTKNLVDATIYDFKQVEFIIPKLLQQRLITYIYMFIITNFIIIAH